MTHDYQDYWNDAANEKNKPYAVQSVDDPRLLRWLREETNLERGFADAVDFLCSNLNWSGGRVLDVGAGVCWTSAILSRLSQVTAVRAVDYSRHRIEEYAPRVIEQFGGSPDKIDAVVGDFSSIAESDRFDLIVFCQALYMFSDPRAMLQKCRTQLRAGGVVMITCEQIEPEYSLGQALYWKTILRTAVRGRADASGRHRMVASDYRQALEQTGFKYHRQDLSYAFIPSAIDCPGANHFGIKEE